MPCPELEILGLARGDDCSIYDLLSKPDARKEFKEYSVQIIEIINQYRKCNSPVKIKGVQDAKFEEAVDLDKEWDES